ncbi:MAG TPA: glycosyltransferase family 4 protein [Vicinamibacterales bacterium]|nr:glycosyltransferase family 4 protein [Vicinamibacterales bacterium]
MGKWSHRVADALEAHGHEVTLWFGQDVLGTRPSSFSVVFMYPVSLAMAIFRRRTDFDVVVVHEPGGLWYSLGRRLTRSLPPIVAMCHNVESKWFHQWVRFSKRGHARIPFWSRIKSPLCRTWQSDGTIRWADHVVCLSSEDQAYITQVLGRRAEDVTRTANGVASDDFVASGSRHQFSVLFVGGWLDVKGAGVLPAVFRRLRERLPEARLTIAGAGAPIAAITSKFASDDRPYVRVLDQHLDAAGLRNLYRSHVAFLMPSLSEGSPLSLLEAMAGGCVAVAAATGGIPDIIRGGREGIDGLLFQPASAREAADRLVTVLTDSGRAEALSRAAVARARSFTWAATARAIECAATHAMAAGEHRP